LYLRVPQLGEELRVMNGNGGFTKWLLQVARTNVLLLDDWGVASLDAMVRNDLLEMIDDRSAGKATIVTSQLPIELWHGWIGDETIADAVLDRLMHRHHRIKLTGESLRKPPPKASVFEPERDQTYGGKLQSKPRNAQPRRFGHVPENSGHVNRNTQTHRTYLWTYRPGAFEPMKAVIYDFAESRAGEHARALLGTNTPAYAHS